MPKIILGEKNGTGEKVRNATFTSVHGRVKSFHSPAEHLGGFRYV